MYVYVLDIQSCPKEPHLTTVKHIGTQNLGLFYPRNNNFKLIGNTDADFSGSRLDKKRTGVVAML